ncbi:MAG: hypothetical protein MMC23_007090 [Stictis urceolatum]|nr:hypothetical protein [Stictis urceolata]
MSHAGQVALVTGGSKGIGAATVLKLASEGAKVVINYSSSSAPADALVSKIGSDKALAIKANAGSISEISSLVEQTVSAFGKIDILVLNAGIMPMRDLASTTEEDFDQIFAVNVKGPYFLAQKAAPHMPPGSHIVFLSTTLTAASTVQPGYLLYNSTKGAVEQMTKVIAKELGKKGIRVNCVAPGPTGTELFYKGKPEAMINGIKGMNPFGEIGEPGAIADTIAFLGSQASRWVSGQVVRVNGAMA